MRSTAKTEVKIPKSVMEAMREIEDAHSGPVVKEFTDEMDAVILEFWPKKKKVAFREWFKECYGIGNMDRIRERYRELSKNA